ncbi:MAG: phosphoglucosamine mutase [Myxococcales bacterium]|nr:phosphoglucosamine mutase [Myxococcales bacterium]
MSTKNQARATKNTPPAPSGSKRTGSGPASSSRPKSGGSATSAAAPAAAKAAPVKAPAPAKPAPKPAKAADKPAPAKAADKPAAKKDEKAAPVRRLFGTDGIRGVANEAPMVPELALKLGRAVTFVAGRGKAHAPRILIGKDTRLSGYMLETALAAGICSMGGRVILCGPIPTPAIAHLTTSMRADAGIVISASHNPYMDNGIKIFGPDGFKLPDEMEAEIERLMENDAALGLKPTGPGVGSAERFDDSRGRYVTFVKSSFPRELSLDGMRIVVDAAHGAAYRVAPLVFQELGAHMVTLGVRPNGVNINKDCGALHPDNLRAEVVKRRAHIGIALDGDADRVIVIDEKGQIVDGDVVMAMCARSLADEGRLAKKTLVATVMSNLGLERAMQRLGGKLVRTAVGDRYVVEAMRAGGYNLGGEQSGHLVFLDYASTGDGVVAALQVLAIMQRTGRQLSELAQGAMERVPQILENVSLPARKPLEAMATLGAGIAKVEAELGDDGRVLVRWSGTEPKLRIMLEGPNEDKLRRWAKDLAQAAKKDVGG